MKKISITVSDDRLRKIEANATRLGISLEELVLRGFEELANQPEAAFEDAMTYVISKNAELYQRLQ
ncbi:MAG TPA: DNA-binding protein [Oscillatoriaceae cyanobacterium M33_DOE_052]|uniref:DNA-binding protein n=1 Tax=Planktothricoides sp. SpSt-374 TaxID=2282167 RepID=A0A7C3ZNH4_9CYAN|nr:DNA-binding protein [Oscillatoriaceae cyanobacterium M33_DOE_052]